MNKYYIVATVLLTPVLVYGLILFFYTNNKDHLSEVVQGDQVYEDVLVDKNLIPEKIKPSDWTRVEGVGFDFKYPANIFTINDFSLGENYEWTRTFRNSMYGVFSVRVLDMKFDLSKIEGVYGRVDNPEIIYVSDRIAYSYLEGDAGCGWKKILAPLNEDKTLEFVVSSCYDYVYPLYQEEELIQSILDTFEFKK